MQMDSLEENTEDILDTKYFEEDVEIPYDLETLNKEYDMYNDHLFKKLQLMKEERKKAESETEVLKNRVISLQIQEKAAIQKFERTKWQINQIVENRKHFKVEDNRTKIWKETSKKEAEELKERVKKMKMSRSVIKIDKKGKKNKEKKNSNIINNKTPSVLISTHSKEEVDKVEKFKQLEKSRHIEQYKKEILEQKNKLKEEIKRKIQIAEENRRKLENLLAQVEKQELEILEKFKIDKSKEIDNSKIEKIDLKNEVGIGKNPPIIYKTKKHSSKSVDKLKF